MPPNGLKLIRQYKLKEHRNKTKNQTTMHQDDEQNILHSSDRNTKARKKHEINVDIIYLCNEPAYITHLHLNVLLFSKLIM